MLSKWLRWLVDDEGDEDAEWCEIGGLTFDIELGIDTKDEETAAGAMVTDDKVVEANRLMVELFLGKDDAEDEGWDCFKELVGWERDECWCLLSDTPTAGDDNDDDDNNDDDDDNDVAVVVVIVPVTDATVVAEGATAAAAAAIAAALISSRLCDRWCFCWLTFWAKPLLQTEQWNGLSVECVNMCFFKLALCVKLRSHVSHLYGFCPEWINIWILRLAFCVNVFLQISQEWNWFAALRLLGFTACSRAGGGTCTCAFGDVNILQHKLQLHVLIQQHALSHFL